MEAAWPDSRPPWICPGGGIRVTLVEKTPFLGGNTALLDRLFPTGEKASELVEGLAAAALADDRIQILTCARVTAAEGYVGNFKLKIRLSPPGESDAPDSAAATEAGLFPLGGVRAGSIPDRDRELDTTTGAIILATGFRHYEPARG